MTAVAVGDADQSIYEFRGGSKHYLEKLIMQDGFTRFSLTENHRCHPSIDNYAKRLFDPHSPLRETTELRVFRGSYPGGNSGLAHEISKWIS